jgi:PAS domain S-box-containing protein
MGRTFDKSVLASIGLVVALLVGNAGIAYRNTRQLLEDAGWVAHTHEVLDLTSDVLRTLVDAETGQRGFLITGKESFLEPYHQAIARLNQQVRTLKDKTSDNPRQQARIEELEKLTAELLAMLQQGIDLRRRSAKQAQALVSTGKGKQKMDTLRQLIATMEEEEHNLLLDRERQSGVAYRNAVATELLAAALGLALVGALVYLVRRSIKDHTQAAALVHEQRERLHITLTSIGDGVIVTDAGDRVTLMNRVAQAMTGWEDGAAGRPLGEVFHIVNEQTRQPVESPVTRVIREAVVVGLANHTALIARDGTAIPIDDSGAPIRNAEGEIIGVVLVFRDVTERRRLERLQRDLQSELERQVQERTAELRASEAQGGLGIGLTLVRSLVEMHGGTVTAHSEGPGKGSQFIVRLPALSQESSMTGARAAGEGQQPAPAARQHRIVVVDDNVDAAESLALLLRLQGHGVRVAHDGRTALAAVEAEPPDIVFLDIGMPVMNGYEVARQLRQWPGLENLLLVAMTGWGQEEDRRRSKEAGFDHHLVKPVEPEALHQLLAHR